MTSGHKRKRFHSHDDVDDGNDGSSQSRLKTRITKLIERQKIQHQPPGCSRSENLKNGFIRHIWPEIRGDYRQMTTYLEDALKKVLNERRIDAEVLGRVKEDESITKTLERRQKCLMEHRGDGFNSYQDIFREMHDLSGLRIVLMNREHRNTAQKLIEELFNRQKPPAHFDPNREVGQFWRRPWFGAYETHNYRVQFAHNNRAFLRESHTYSGVMFEIQLTTFADNLYNKLAHALLYKADPGLVTEQEEMVIDVSHGLARCFELCMRILRPKLHRDADKRTADTAEDFRGNTEKEVIMARSVVESFEKDLQSHSKSDRTAQLLRKLLDDKEDAGDQACLRDLLDSDPRDDKRRIEDTKGGLLPKSYNWILEDHDFQRWQENGQHHPFWITGAPGKGKTMMLCGIIDELSNNSKTNVAYFFCQGTDKRINTGTAVLRGLLFLLCKQQHSLISHIQDKYGDAGRKLFEDTNAWFALSGIFDNILRDSRLRHTYLIVDALDECLTDSRQLLVKLIVRTSNAHSNIKWIVSSRELNEFATHLQRTTHLSLESRGESVSTTVNAYIDLKVTKLLEQGFSHSAVEQIASELQRKSEGTFLWVAIVCKELESAPEYDAMDILQEMPTGLDELYGKLVQDIKALKRRTPTYCESVLRVVAVAFRPLSLKEIQEQADLPPNVHADGIAKMCRSLLTIRDDTVFFVHQSAKDYLWEKWDIVFQSCIQSTHESMFSRSVEAMKRALRQDIYCLGYPGISIEEIRRPSPDPLVSTRYSCVYWITHFREAQPCSAGDKVHSFLRDYFLYWLEALSLIRSASTAESALRDLVTLCSTRAPLESLLHLVNDMYRFARSCGEVIGNAPLQAYSSALIFSPARSLTRNLFSSKEPGWIVQKPTVEQNWDSCLATLMSYPDEVYSVAFSPDGRHIASGSSDGTITIWDAESGAETLTLQGHTHRVWSVAFDEEGKSITSMSDDETVKTWQAETGICVSTCVGSRRPKSEVAFSPDKRLIIACPSFDSILHIMDSCSNTEALALVGHREPVCSVAFSRDGRLIASGSGDKTVKIWDSATGIEISTLRGHTGLVSSICFSPDSCRIASASEDGTVRIWDVEVSTHQGHYGHRDPVRSVALTLDGHRIASASRDGTVIIWDAETGDVIRTLIYDFEYGVWPVTFSPDGRRIAAAGYLDTVVVISDVESGATISTCYLPYDGPLALSLSGRYVATGWGEDIETQDAEDGKTAFTLRGHGGYVTSLAFSPKDCHIIASASRDKTMKIWNVVLGAEILSFNVCTELRVLRFDPTGGYLHTDSLSRFRDSTWSSTSTPSPTDLVLPQIRQGGYGVNGVGSWITWHGQKVLWLPPEFRESEEYPQRAWDILPDMISIGCPSGRVWWITFSSENHPFAPCEHMVLE